MEKIIETRNLSKHFKQLAAVSDLSFSIGTGEIFGLLGQNGSGKSTTMRMLLGLIFPDEGSVYIKGEKFNNSKRHLLAHTGAIIERPDMYNYLTAWDNLKVCAALSRQPITKNRYEAVLEQVGLKERAKEKVKTYSQGMKQRLAIALALLHDPDLLILDEPTNGLDPQGIADMRNLILNLAKEHNKTVLISSHLLYEIEQVATSMLILHKGKKIAEGKVKDLLNPHETLVDIAINANREIIQKIRSSQWQELLVQATVSTLSFKTHTDRIPEINKWLVTEGAEVLQISSRHSLEAYFLSLTND